MKDTVRVTLVQMTDDGDAEGAVARMPAFFSEAANHHSDLIVFPEYILGRGLRLSDPKVLRFRELTRRAGIYAIAGLVEQHGSKGATTALLIDRQGEVLGRSLKCHPASGPPPHYWPPTASTDEEARGILGHQFKVFHLDFGTVSILQCYDGNFPESWGCASFRGAELVLWINGREGLVEDWVCLFAAQAYGCVVGGNISNGRNTGFAGPWGQYVEGEGERQEGRLFPRLARSGDGAVHATINLRELRRHRKHLRHMHQRRPELYTTLIQPVKIWQDYPEIPWDFPECEKTTNRAELT